MGIETATMAKPMASESDEVKFFDPAPLRIARKALRLTQQEVANLLGIHRTYLVLIETGKRLPSPKLQRFIDEFIYKAEKERENHNPGTFGTMFPGLSSPPPFITRSRTALRR